MFFIFIFIPIFIFFYCYFSFFFFLDRIRLSEEKVKLFPIIDCFFIDKENSAILLKYFVFSFIFDYLKIPSILFSKKFSFDYEVLYILIYNKINSFIK